MNKTKKVSLITGASLVGAVAIAAPIIATTTQTTTNTNISKPSVNEYTPILNSSNTTRMKIEKVDENFAKFKVSILNSETEYGKVTFEQGLTEIVASPSDKIKLESTIYKENYTISSIDIYDEKNPNIMLGVEKEGNDFYFQMPSIETEFGYNDFYQSGNIVIDVNYQLTQVNQWVYNFETKSYDLIITEDNYIFDDVINPKLKMEAQNDYTNYRIYLMGNNLTIRNLTIPKHCDLEFINNKDNTFENTKPIVSLEKGGNLIINGVIGRYGSVAYSDEISLMLGLPMEYWN